MRGIDRFFGISSRGSTVATEIRGGVTSFLTMAYILVVNPQILSQAGMPAHDVAVATALASAAATLVLMPLTYSIATGIAFGMISWVALRVLGGRRRDVTPAMWIVCLFLVLFFVLG